MAETRSEAKSPEGKSLHSICRWTFNAGKGGFVPGDMRPEWGGSFGTPEMIELTAKKVRPRPKTKMPRERSMPISGFAFSSWRSWRFGFDY